MIEKPSKLSLDAAKREIAALKSKNLQLLKKLDKCKAENMALKNQISILEEKLEKEKQKPKYEDVTKVFARIEKDNIKERESKAEIT